MPAKMFRKRLVSNLMGRKNSTLADEVDCNKLQFQVVRHLGSHILLQPPVNTGLQAI
jgi:hypothetical protein